MNFLVGGGRSWTTVQLSTQKCRPPPRNTSNIVKFWMQENMAEITRPWRMDTRSSPKIKWIFVCQVTLFSHIWNVSKRIITLFHSSFGIEYKKNFNSSFEYYAQKMFKENPLSIVFLKTAFVIKETPKSDDDLIVKLNADKKFWNNASFSYCFYQNTLGLTHAISMCQGLGAPPTQNSRRSLTPKVKAPQSTHILMIKNNIESSFQKLKIFCLIRSYKITLLSYLLLPQKR